MLALVQTDGSVPDFAVRVCATFRERVRGLLVLIERCSSVHTFGMRYALDLAFVGRDGTVEHVRRNVEPGHLCSCQGAAFVLERPHTLSTWFSVGDTVRVAQCDAWKGELP